MFHDKWKFIEQYYSRYSLFWDVTRRRLETGYLRFGTTYRLLLLVSSSPRRILLELICLGDNLKFRNFIPG